MSDLMNCSECGKTHGAHDHCSCDYGQREMQRHDKLNQPKPTRKLLSEREAENISIPELIPMSMEPKPPPREPRECKCLFAAGKNALFAERVEMVEKSHADQLKARVGELEERDVMRGNCIKLMIQQHGKDLFYKNQFIEKQKETIASLEAELALQKHMPGIGAAHYKSERDIHVSESETFVKQATDKISEQGETIARLTREKMSAVKQAIDFREALEKIAAGPRFRKLTDDSEPDPAASTIAKTALNGKERE